MILHLFLVSKCLRVLLMSDGALNRYQERESIVSARSMRRTPMSVHCYLLTLLFTYDTAFISCIKVSSCSSDVGWRVEQVQREREHRIGALNETHPNVCSLLSINTIV